MRAMSLIERQLDVELEVPSPGAITSDERG